MAKVQASNETLANIVAGTKDPADMDMLEAADELALLAAAIAYHDSAITARTTPPSVTPSMISLSPATAP